MKKLYSLLILFLLFHTSISHAQCETENSITILNSDFESEITPWSPNKTNTLEISTAQSHSDQSSLFISNRTATWHGPSYNLLNKLTPGNKYCINAWVKWESGVSDKINITIQQATQSGYTYKIIDKKLVSSNGWTLLSGTFDYNPTEDVNVLSLYIEQPYSNTSDPQPSFYLDDFSISGSTSIDASVNNIFSEKGLNGTVYYVSPAGSDNNTGISETSAFRTLQKASNSTNPGDIVYAMNGTYQVEGNRDILHISRSGTASNWIMYSALPGHKPKLKLNKYDAIGVWGADYIVIQGFEIEGNNNEVTLEYAEEHQDEPYNRITNSTGITIHRDFWGTGAGYNNFSHHVIIRNNHVYNCSGGGIGAGRADYVIIENNKVHHNAYYSPWAASGISFFNNFNFDDSNKYKMIIRNNISYANRNYIPFLYFSSEIPTITDGHGIIVDTNKESIKIVDGNRVTVNYTGRTLVANNISYLNGGRGFNLYKSNHVDAINNTAYRNGETLRYLSEIMIGDSDDINVFNNIFYTRDDTENPFFTYWLGDQINIDNNLVYNASIPISPSLNNKFGDDPLFMNTSGPIEEYNFRLQENSPALDAGSNQFTTNADILGNVRPENGVVDIGAYEKQ